MRRMRGSTGAIAVLVIAALAMQCVVTHAQDSEETVEDIAIEWDDDTSAQRSMVSCPAPQSRLPACQSSGVRCCQRAGHRLQRFAMHSLALAWRPIN